MLEEARTPVVASEPFVSLLVKRPFLIPSTVTARVSPAFFPAIQIGLRLFQTLEPQALQRCFLRVTDTGFDFTFAIRIAHATRQRDHSVVLEHIAIQRIERGIVDVGGEHALAQVVQHDDACDSSESAEGLLV